MKKSLIFLKYVILYGIKRNILLIGICGLLLFSNHFFTTYELGMYTKSIGVVDLDNSSLSQSLIEAIGMKLDNSSYRYIIIPKGFETNISDRKSVSIQTSKFSQAELNVAMSKVKDAKLGYGDINVIEKKDFILNDIILLIFLGISGLFVIRNARITGQIKYMSNFVNYYWFCILDGISLLSILISGVIANLVDWRGVFGALILYLLCMILGYKSNPYSSLESQSTFIGLLLGYVIYNLILLGWLNFLPILSLFSTLPLWFILSINISTLSGILYYLIFRIKLTE